MSKQQRKCPSIWISILRLKERIITTLTSPTTPFAFPTPPVGQYTKHKIGNAKKTSSILAKLYPSMVSACSCIIHLVPPLVETITITNIILLQFLQLVLLRHSCKLQRDFLALQILLVSAMDTHLSIHVLIYFVVAYWSSCNRHSSSYFNPHN